VFTLVDSLEDLNYLNKELLERPFVGVDTEFRRTTKDNMKLALLQVNDNEEIYLIDTILIEKPEEHCSFLFSHDVVKIFHSCKEDIEAIYSWTGNILNNIFDTQLAEAFLGGEFSISYQGLVESKLGVVIDKGETRSNWMRRPLTDSQLKYATSDVEFLIHLYLEQELLLSNNNKIEWHEEELSFLISKIFDQEFNLVESKSFLSKKEEEVILNRFNDIVKQQALKEQVNPTLLFSKKNQKEFIKLILDIGLEKASKEITAWRSYILKDSLKNLLKEYL